MENAAQRSASETALEAALQSAFAEAINRGPEGASDLVQAVRDAIERQARELFVVVYVLWLMQDDEVTSAPTGRAAIDQAATAAASTYAGPRAQQVARDFVDAVRAEVSALRPLADILTPARAERIAVTETTAAISAAEQAAAANQNGIRGALDLGTVAEAVPYWNAEEDACPVCRKLHGKPAATDPPIHPHCRCWLTWVLSVRPGPE